MATQFEFRLIDAKVPQGQIDVDDAVAILQRLQELATKVGRVEVGAENLGRPDRRVLRVSKLRLVGLTAGSTVIAVERVVDASQLPVDLGDEHAFETRFAEMIEAIGDDRRPDGLSDGIADAAANLVSAFRKAAPELEFSVDGQPRKRFRTTDTHRGTWRPADGPPEDESVSLVGRLEAVDLKSGHFRVRDDVGFTYSLPKVPDALSASRHIGSYVRVAGRGERDVSGRPSKVFDAVIEPHTFPPGVALGAAPAVPLEYILASTPGPTLGGVPGLTEDEAESFFLAMGF